MKITIHVPVREVKANGMTTFQTEPRECEVVAVVRHEHRRKAASRVKGWTLRGPAISWTYMVDVVHPDICQNYFGNEATGGQYRAWVRRADHPGWKPPEGFPEGKPGCVMIPREGGSL